MSAETEELLEQSEAFSDTFEDSGDLNANNNVDAEVFTPEKFAEYLEEYIGEHQASVYDLGDEEARKRVDNVLEYIEPGLRDAANSLLERGADRILVNVDTYERGIDPRYLKFTEGEVSDQVMNHFWEILGDEATYDGLEKGRRVKFARNNEEYGLLIEDLDGQSK